MYHVPNSSNMTGIIFCSDMDHFLQGNAKANGGLSEVLPKFATEAS